MTNHEIEANLRRTFGREAPDALPGILSDCEKQKGTVMVMEKKKRNPWVMRTVGIAAAVAVCVMGGLGIHLYGSRFAVESTVSLDVNPSIEIQVNAKEHVLKVEPKNEDGRKVVGEMDFSGSSLDVTVNALIGSMLRNGYLNENANSILVSVDTRDAAKGSALREKLAGEIDSLLRTDTFSGAVLSQTVAADAALQQLAQEYGISLGKAQLVQEIAAKNPAYTFDALARLSINELNLLMAQNAQVETVASSGKASDKAYITAEKATALALEHANVSADLAVVREAKLDTEDGVLVYEIEFEAGGYEYEYDIDAASGAVVKFEKERDDDDAPSQGGNPGSAPAGDIGEARAKEAAMSHAGVAEADIRDYKLSGIPTTVSGCMRSSLKPAGTSTITRSMLPAGPSSSSTGNRTTMTDVRKARIRGVCRRVISVRPGPKRPCCPTPVWPRPTSGITKLSGIPTTVSECMRSSLKPADTSMITRSRPRTVPS